MPTQQKCPVCKGSGLFPILHVIKGVPQSELEALRKEASECAEAFEQLAFNFPQIQVDCKTPVAAAQFINREWEALKADSAQKRAAIKELFDCLDEDGFTYSFQKHSRVYQHLQAALVR